jgi:hypothetical protein
LWFLVLIECLTAGLSFKFKIAIGVLTETNLIWHWLSPSLFRRSPFIRTHLLTEENTARMQEEGLSSFLWTVNEIEHKKIKRIT